MYSTHFWASACTHTSGSANFIYHYFFCHKISWTTCRRKPKRLQWESFPAINELLKKIKIKMCSTVSFQIHGLDCSDCAKWLFHSPTSVYYRIQCFPLCHPSQIHCTDISLWQKGGHSFVHLSVRNMHCMKLMYN